MLLDKKIENLIKILTYEKQIYQKFSQIAEKKRLAIINGETKELENIIKLEEKCAAEMSQFEEAREGIAGNIEKELGLQKGELTVKKLVEYVDKDNKETISSLQEELTNIAAEIKMQNKLNEKLLKNALEYVDFSLNIMTNIAVEGNNYGKTGADMNNNQNKKNMFDMKL